MKKIITIVLIGMLMISVVGCEKNDSNSKTKNTKTSNSKTNDTKTSNTKNVENNKTQVESAKNKNIKDGLLFTTEYEIEDYCDGIFIVSKSDGLLEGALNLKGKELIPVKYDGISFVNDDEVKRGYDQEVYIQTTYEGEVALLNNKGKQVMKQDVSRTIYELGQAGEEDYYFYSHDGDTITLYTKTGKVLTKMQGIEDNFLFPIELTWISKNNFLVFTRKIGDEVENGNLGGVYRIDGKLGIYHADGQPVQEWNNIGEMLTKKYEDRLIFAIGTSQENYKVTYHLYQVDEKGNLEDLGDLEENQEYSVKNGEIEIRNESVEEKDSQFNSYLEDNEDIIYYLGEKEDIKLYKSNGTWKLEDAFGKPLYDERFYDCKEKDNCYLLCNEDMEVCAVNRNGERIIEYGWMVKKDKDIYFMDQEINKENFFAGNDEVCITVPKDGKTEVYYFDGE